MLQFTELICISFSVYISVEQKFRIQKGVAGFDDGGNVRTQGPSLAAATGRQGSASLSKKQGQERVCSSRGPAVFLLGHTLTDAGYRGAGDDKGAGGTDYPPHSWDNNSKHKMVVGSLRKDHGHVEGVGNVGSGTKWPGSKPGPTTH